MWQDFLDTANNLQQEYGVERRWNPYVLKCTYEGIARTSLLKSNLGKSNMYLNACDISASSDIPTYNIQHLIYTYTYIILVVKYLGETVQL